MQDSAVRYTAASLSVLEGLDPVKSSSCPATEAESNPLLRCPMAAWLAHSIAGSSDNLLEGLRGHRPWIGLLMLKIRRYARCVSRRATWLWGALRYFSPCRALVRRADYDRCWRFIRLMGEHEDAKRECGTWGLAAL